MISISADQIMTWVLSLIWPFVRISAMLLVAPIFGARGVNARMRMGMGLLIAMVIAPQLPAPPLIDVLSMQGLVVAMQQVLIGIAMGFVLQMVFSALTQAGESVALSMGLGFASVVDPAAGVQVPIVSQFFVIIATLLFLAMNGHLVLLEMLLLSFSSMPIGDGGLTPDDFWTLLNFGTTMFGGALLIALPAVAGLLMVNLAMGVVARTAPQLNIFAVGFPVMMLAGFVLLSILLPSVFARLGELMTLGFELIQRLIRL
ncbi:flagellar biosynthetic protein FliR [Thiorhodovibrio frisius]|uniref:Flagellar biosynthetic protein FliR n=1 Tax=Thiorhodovibrio frisius TaxID=631362 RepID=H8YZM2_9GAMM|nr:flagellar biosynthetic protein FliR [Thiorhodovibrio frisius]WPL24443.1 Flagellar biosynthetic protein FliR [Thiorhodovibrio frisius]